MNRSALKNFASWSRSYLRDQVRAVLGGLGVSGRGLVEPSFVAGGMVVGGRSFDAGVAGLYRSLRAEVDARLRAGVGLVDVVEGLVDEGAYTWFNRFTALRFMEVNGFIGRVLSSSSGAVDPDLMRDASGLVGDVALPGVSAQDLEGWRRRGEAVAYRNLLVARCRGLAGVLPSLFGSDKDYLALFLPENLLHEASVVRRLVKEVPEEDWRDIEVVGWLYQFYIAERKDEVFAKKGAYEARDIAPATQIFTPHWIVRYLVENSVGRLWLESHSESGLREHMPYFVEVEGEPLEPSGKRLSPEDLTVLDPACGSGHMLVYAFDLLYRIYVEAGYPERDIARLILMRNLFGVDLDERAAQLTAFALLMKGRARDRSVLRDPPVLNVVHTVATRGWVLPESPALVKKSWEPLVEAFRDADSLGSLIEPPEVDFGALRAQLDELGTRGQLGGVSSEDLEHLLRQGEILAGRFSVVVTNPPYVGSGSHDRATKALLAARYPLATADVFAAFIVRAQRMLTSAGAGALVTPIAWMYLSSFESLRRSIMRTMHVQSVVDLGSGAFTAGFGTTAFIARNVSATKASVTAFQSVATVSESSGKADLVRTGAGRIFRADYVNAFSAIPGMPLAYQAGPALVDVFAQPQRLGDVFRPKKGMATGQNDKFVRSWHEVQWTAIGVALTRPEAATSRLRWFPYASGGSDRRWYGNHDSVVDWHNDGEVLRFERHPTVDRIRATNLNLDEIFRAGITWNYIGFSNSSFRLLPKGFIFADAGSSMFALGPAADKLHLSVLSLLCSRVARLVLVLLNPTHNLQPGNIASIPVDVANLERFQAEHDGIAGRCIDLSREDWDAFERSWDFRVHPLVRLGGATVEAASVAWSREAGERLVELRRLEEENSPGPYALDSHPPLLRCVQAAAPNVRTPERRT